MRKLLFGTVAAMGLALGFAPQQASAYWAYRTSYSYDPACGRFVAYQERYWVPDCDPPPVISYRVYRDYHHHREHHGHYEHHRDHHHHGR